MDAMVSARIPIEMKKRGDKRLKELGASTTELINAAYLYLLEEGQIPGRQDAVKRTEPTTKTLEGAAAKEFAALWRARSPLKAPGYTGQNFKALLETAKEECYAGVS